MNADSPYTLSRLSGPKSKLRCAEYSAPARGRNCCNAAKAALRLASFHAGPGITDPQCRRLRCTECDSGRVSFRTRRRRLMTEYCHSTKTMTAMMDTATRKISIGLLLQVTV